MASGEPASPARTPARPGDGSTVAEIREYAAERGIVLPAKGRKADLLAAIEKEG